MHQGAPALSCADTWEKGFLYKDVELLSEGVLLAKPLSGDEGKSTILVKAKNNSAKSQLDLPTGIAAALAGSASATLQIHGSDTTPGCFSRTFSNVVRNDGVIFKAK